MKRKLRIKASGEALSGDQERTMGKVPCYECEQRTETCHASCEKYKAYSMERIEINRDLRKHKGLYISERSKRQYWRNLRTQSRKYVKK